MAETLKKVVFNNFNDLIPESPIISYGKITPLQLIIKHRPIVAGSGYTVYVKTDLAAAYEPVPLIVSDTDGEIIKSYTFPDGLTYEFMQFQIDSVEDFTEEQPELVLLFHTLDLESHAKQLNTSEIGFDVSGHIQTVDISGILNWTGPYDNAADYAVGDSVDYNGSSYVMFNDGPAGTLPTDTSYWQVIANKGDTGATGVTGLQGPAGPSGLDGSDGTTKVWVSNAYCATTAALPACTYANGALGVGATLTADANGALAAQDGITLVDGQTLLVKNQVDKTQNGLYDVTAIGNAGTPFILTRNTGYDQAAEILTGTWFYILLGTTLTNTEWYMSKVATVTVGTTNIEFTQFADTFKSPGTPGSVLSNQLGKIFGDSALIYDSTRKFLSINAGLYPVSALSLNYRDTISTTYIVASSFSFGGTANLLLQSSTMNSSWTRNDIAGAITLNVANDSAGSATADRIPVGSNATANLSQSIANATLGNFCFSVDLQAEGSPAVIGLQIDSNTQTGTPRFFTVGLADANGLPERFSVVQNLSVAHANVIVRIIVGIRTIVVSDAQLNLGMQPVGYMRTTTSSSPAVGTAQIKSALTIAGALAGCTTIGVSGIITHTRAALANVSTDGYVGVNTTAATTGSRIQRSPRMRLSGGVWNTNGAGSDNSIGVIQEVIPVSGNPPTFRLVWSTDLNGAGYVERMSLSNLGKFEIKGGLKITDDTNYAEFGANGFLGLAGTARHKKIINLGIDGLVAGVVPAMISRVGNSYGYAFDINVAGFVRAFSVPNDWDETTPLVIKIQWYCDNTSAGKLVSWKIDFNATAKNSELINAGTTTITADSDDIAVSTTAFTLVETSITLTAGTIDDFITILLTRVAATGGAGVVPDNFPVVIGIDVEYTANKLGKTI